MSTRPVPMPRTCSTLYAVLTPEALDVEDHVALPSDALLRSRGTSDLALARMHRCRYQLVLQHRVPLEAAAGAARDARVEALELAARHDGVVVELLVPRIVEVAPEDVALEHADQWYVLDYAALLDGVLETVGLEQLGLPEVRVVGTDPAQQAMTTAVTAGLVHRLIAEWPANDPVGPATVTLRDIAFGLGDAQAASTPKDRSIDVEIAYAEATHTLDVSLLQDPAVALFA